MSKYFIDNLEKYRNKMIMNKKVLAKSEIKINTGRRRNNSLRNKMKFPS